MTDLIITVFSLELEGEEPYLSGKNIPGDAEGPQTGGSTLGLKTSETGKTSPCIELTSELEVKRALAIGGRGGGSENRDLLGGKGGVLGDVLGVDMIIDRVGFSAITDSSS